MSTPAPLGEQRRQFSRVLFRASAHLRVAGHERPCEVLDLSLKGALIRIDDAAPAPNLSVGESCTLVLQLGESDLIAMSVEVSHRTGARVGLHCLTIDLDSVCHLRRLVELNVGDDAILQRELAALVAEA